MPQQFPRKPRSRVLHCTTEADADLAAIRDAIRECVEALVVIHKQAGHASQHIVQANEIISASELVERQMVGAA